MWSALSLVGAEMALAWEQAGGVGAWGKEASSTLWKVGLCSNVDITTPVGYF